MLGGRQRLLAVCWCLLVVIGGIAGPASGAAVDAGSAGDATASNSENRSPFADAGLDRDVSANATVYLDATGSYDPDGTITSYEWRIERPDGTLTDPVCEACARTRFVAYQPGTYNVTVTVTDDDGAQQSDTLRVSASEPSGPEVTLSGPTDIQANATHEFTASVTTGDATLTRVRWFVDGDRVAADDLTGESATRDRSQSFAENGTHSVGVEVVDRLGRRADAATNVTVTDPPDGDGGNDSGNASTPGSTPEPNDAPVVESLSDRTATPGETVSLTADATDPDGDSLTYDWRVRGDGDLDFRSDQGRRVTATAPESEADSTVEVVVRVSDDNGGQDTATGTISVEPSETTDPEDPSESGDSGGSDGTDDSGGSDGTDDSGGSGGTGDSCQNDPTDTCDDSPLYYNSEENYEAGWCTSSKQSVRQGCGDFWYPEPNNQNTFVDNNGDHEIHVDVGVHDLLIGIIPEESNIATMTLSDTVYNRVRENAWDAYWNESVSQRSVAVRQGERGWDI